MKAFLREAIVLAAYTVATVTVTYPLVPNLGTVIPGDGDAWQFYWNLWWVKRAILDLHASPFFTSDMYFPYGASLYFHTLNLLPSALVLPIVATAGLTPAYNALVLLSFVTSAYGMFRLALYVLTRDGIKGAEPRFTTRMAAFVAGLIFAFSAYRFVHTLGHLDLLSTQWLPFTVLFLLKSRTEAGWRNLVACVILLAATALTSWYYLLFVLVFVALVLADDIVRRNWTAVRRVTLSLLLLVLVISPILVPMVSLARTEGRTIDPAYDIDRFSTDLLAFVTPSFMHPVWGDVVAPWYVRFARSNSGIESVAFLGYVALILAGVGAFSSRVARRFWLVAFIGFCTLALGPVAYFNGRPVTPPWLPMPYQWLTLSPFGDLPRVPARFVVMAYMSLAILAAAGVLRLLRDCSQGAAVTVTMLLAALVLGETAIGALPVSQVRVPPFYETLGRDQVLGALLEVPIPDDPAEFPRRMLYQTRHQQPVHGGYVSRGLPPFQFDAMPGFAQFKTLTDQIDDIVHYQADELEAVSLAVFDVYGTRHLVIDKTQMEVPDAERARQIADRLFGDRFRAFEDADRVAYHVRPPHSSAPPSIWLDTGWSYLEREPAPDGRLLKWRWMGRRARVAAIAGEPVKARLRFSARALQQARTLRLTVGATPLTVLEISPVRATYETSRFDLRQGVSFIELVSDAVSRPGTSDPRLLSVAVFELTLLID